MAKEILDWFLLIIAIMLLLKELYCFWLVVKMWWKIKKTKKELEQKFYLDLLAFDFVGAKSDVLEK